MTSRFNVLAHGDLDAIYANLSGDAGGASMDELQAALVNVIDKLGRLVVRVDKLETPAEAAERAALEAHGDMTLDELAGLVRMFLVALTHAQDTDGDYKEGATALMMLSTFVAWFDDVDDVWRHISLRRLVHYERDVGA